MYFLTFFVLIVSLILYSGSIAKYAAKALQVYITYRSKRQAWVGLSNCILPMVGLRRTRWFQTPDHKLTKLQIQYKETANRYGLRVKLISKK